ncbi:conserved hypothetical protein [Candidatus Sulfobium mesophilum]|uniref:Uncharacterized protein n=1 Tax=Candidatus Sulfobium mesophilum TaxID=2016548 RepID=A0A2U3QLA8_9BACT|nr:conserved hypothetical protein [Candidatus Sulfobium mesophilum]
MNMPEYVTVQEVRRVCKELGIRDWSRLKKSAVTSEEATKILKKSDAQGMKIDIDQFRAGLEVELEHGIVFKTYNVTNNHPLLTGKIVLAHFMESLDYYRRLEVMEIEGDLFKAVAGRKQEKARKYMTRLAYAKAALAKAEAGQLK